MTAPPSGAVQLRTSRLLLRGAIPSDSTPLFQVFSDPLVMAYWSSLPHSTLEQTQNWIDHMIANPQNSSTDFIIVDSSSDTPIGKIGIWSGQEIGFLLARPYWRKGLVSEALGALLPYFFSMRSGDSELMFPKIVADVDPRNSASWGILQKFGFVETGRREKTYSIGGEWVDSVDLELTKDAWQAWQNEHPLSKTQHTNHRMKTMPNVQKMNSCSLRGQRIPTS